jgi:hypothetical protein
MATNYGLTLIKMPAGVIRPDESAKDLTWEEFSSWISRAKLYSDEEIIKILGNSSHP